MEAGGKRFRIEIDPDNIIRIDGLRSPFSVAVDQDGISYICSGNRNLNAYCKRLSEEQFEVWIGHHIIIVQLQGLRSRLIAEIQSVRALKEQYLTIRAPMPGLVKRIEVGVGDTIKPGSGLLILEAMKMENEIRSPLPGVVRQVHATQGATVEKDEPLIVIEEVASASASIKD